MQETLQKVAHSTLSDLEALRVVHRTLSDTHEPYDFGDWITCTCGHIYAGALRGGELLDEMPSGTNPITETPDERYQRLLALVVQANGGWGRLAYERGLRRPVRRGWREPDKVLETIALSRVVSQLTRDMVLAHGIDARTAARLMIERTIEMVHKQQEQDRLDVLAQARKVVDSAPPAEERGAVSERELATV